MTERLIQTAETCDVFNGIQVTGTRRIINVPLLINPLLIREFAEAHVAVMESVEIGRRIDENEVDNLEAFLYTSLAMRVFQTNGIDGKLFKEYTYLGEIMIPAVWAQIIDGVGNVFDPETSIQLTVTMDVDEKKRLPASQFHSYLRHLKGYQKSMVLVPWPKGKTGSLPFMSKVLISEEIKSFRGADSPVYAFLSSIVSKELIQGVCDDVFRFDYGTLAYYRSHVDPDTLSRLVQPMTRMKILSTEEYNTLSTRDQLYYLIRCLMEGEVLEFGRGIFKFEFKPGESKVHVGYLFITKVNSVEDLATAKIKRVVRMPDNQKAWQEMTILDFLAEREAEHKKLVRQIDILRQLY